MLEKELKIEGRKSGKVFRANFTDGEKYYQFRIGSTEDYVNMVYGDKKFENCRLWWFPDEHSFAIESPEGEYKVDYSRIDEGIIGVSINGINDRVLKIADKK